VFAGRYDHALDEKGRTMMPKRFRDRLAISSDRTVWIANALDGPGHLEVRPATSFQAYFERVSKLKQTPQILDFKRYYFGAAMEVEVDGAGRILVPASLRQKIGLTDKITFVGADEHYFELWNPDALDRRFTEVSASTGDILRHLAEAGL